MKRRILSVLLSAVMLLTLLPGMAFAAEGEAPAAPSLEQIIDLSESGKIRLYGTQALCEGKAYSGDKWEGFPEANQFQIGEVKSNTDAGTQAKYPWVCGLTAVVPVSRFFARLGGGYKLDKDKLLIDLKMSDYVTATLYYGADGWCVPCNEDGSVNTELNPLATKNEHGNFWLTIWATPGEADEDPDVSEKDKPSGKPVIDTGNDLYQVVVMCKENGAHYWSYTSKHDWATTADQFAVGEIRKNDLNNGTAAQYPYICPVTPAYTLAQCLANVNGDHAGHHLVTTESSIPVAYYYWNAEDGWALLKDKQPDENVTFNQNNTKHEGTLTVYVSCAQEEQPELPASKPVVGEELYQVEIVCREKGENPSHWWSSPNQETWAWVNEFAVGEIEANKAYQPDTYPWRCPVTPKESLETYLGRLNAKVGEGSHRLLTTQPPVAYYYYNGETKGWEFVKDPAANPGCTVSADGKNTYYLTIQATCAEQTGPVWLTDMNIMGYDLFTKEPEKLPDTADGRYLVLARSGVEGDTDVYALYLNPAPCQPNNGVVAGQSITAAKLAMEDGALVGYLAGTEEKVTLDQLLLTAGAVEGGYTLSNGESYLNFSGATMVGGAGALEISSRPGVSGAYKVAIGKRHLTLYVAEQHAYNASWQTNFWTPQADQGEGAVKAMGSSYIYFLHTHVEDGKTVAAFDQAGKEIADVDGYLTIPGGGRIEVDGQVTFTVPGFVDNVKLHKNYASALVMDENGGFGVMGCVVTMQDGTTTSSISRSGSAGSGVTFARTGDNRLYFAGEGAMRDCSSRNNEVPAWLDSMGDRTLKSVSIGPGVTSVGSNAFKFTALSAVTLSEGLESIGDSAFESCRITAIQIPDTVDMIGDNAFKGCLGLRSIQLPESVSSIGANVFANCTRLRSVTFAGTPGSIPNGAFQAMSGHGQLSLVFQAGAPASAYSGFAGMLPFLHQNGAIIYTPDEPGEALVACGGTDAYFAVTGDADLSGIELRSGILPELPAKGGVAFTGWQLGTTTAALPGGSAVSGQPAGTVFTARWGGEYTVACTVTIDGVGYTVAKGQTMGSQMPADPVREGLRFAGWVDAEGNPFTADTTVTGNMVVTSTWTEIPLRTVTLNANGGVLAGRSEFTVYEGSEVTLLQLPGVTRAGYTFDGWFTPSGERFLGGAVAADLTLTARWTEEGAQPDTPAPSGPSGGTAGTTKPPKPQGETPKAQLTFVDVDKDAWYAGAVAFVYDKGLMKGVSEISFAPNSTVSRGMMAQIMYNVAGQPKVTDKPAFTDLMAGVYYADAVAWGVNNQILNGYSDTRFGGEDVLSREQAAVMLYRYACTKNLGKNADLSVLDAFGDRGKVSGWAAEAMAWAVENGLIQGRSGSILDPASNISRAEAAAILERYAKLFQA